MQVFSFISSLHWQKWFGQISVTPTRGLTGYKNALVGIRALYMALNRMKVSKDVKQWSPRSQFGDGCGGGHYAGESLEKRIKCFF